MSKQYFVFPALDNKLFCLTNHQIAYTFLFPLGLVYAIQIIYRLKTCKYTKDNLIKFKNQAFLKSLQASFKQQFILHRRICYWEIFFQVTKHSNVIIFLFNIVQKLCQQSSQSKNNMTAEYKQQSLSIAYLDVWLHILVHDCICYRQCRTKQLTWQLIKYIKYCLVTNFREFDLLWPTLRWKSKYQIYEVIYSQCSITH